MSPASRSESSKDRENEITDKALIIIYGASGDLAKKLVYPALFALFADGRLPDRTRIIGYARSELEKEKFRDQVVGGLDDDADKTKVDDFMDLNSYVRGAYDKDEGYQNLEKTLQHVTDDEFDGESNRVFYLALPPSQFTLVGSMVRKHNHNGKTNRLVIEKPFGKDTETCSDMMDKITSDWEEKEIYRIDHFLGDEMVRNISHLRFANEHLIDSLLNKDKVAAVKVELRETFGCEGRGGYFDEYGMIRDVLQNHLLQVVLAIATDRPSSLHADHLRDEKMKVLNRIHPVETKHTVFGQYTGNGEKAGYLEDESVDNKESKTETFASIVLYIDNQRWQGVPFILTSGKALESDLNRLTVQLKQSENPLYPTSQPTELRVDLIPENKVSFAIQNKAPGLDDSHSNAELVLNYKDTFKDRRVPSPYETVWNAILEGDQSLFVREDELIASWKIFTPLLHEREGKNSTQPIEYKYGSSGPKEAVELEKKVGFVSSDRKQ